MNTCFSLQRKKKNQTIFIPNHKAVTFLHAALLHGSEAFFFFFLWRVAMASSTKFDTKGWLSFILLYKICLDTTHCDLVMVSSYSGLVTSHFKTLYALTDFCLRKGKHFWVPPYYVNCTAVTCQKFYLSSLFQYSNTEKSLWSSSLNYSGTPSQTLCFTLCGITSSSSAFRYFSFWSAIWSQNSDS